MSKVDRIKEELSWLKIVFAIFVATDLSLIVWLAQNYSILPQTLILFCCAGVALITLALIWVNQAAIKRFKQLEEE